MAKLNIPFKGNSPKSQSTILLRVRSTLNILLSINLNDVKLVDMHNILCILSEMVEDCLRLSGEKVGDEN